MPDALSRAPHIDLQPATGMEDAATRFANAHVIARQSDSAHRVAKVRMMFENGKLFEHSVLNSIIVEPTFLA